ncbi:MAG: Omp28-related outer membrane protein [Bacteroidaceae bacterium]
MKRNTLFAWLLGGLCLALPVQASEADAASTRMRIGYSDGHMSLNLGLLIEVHVQGAIQFPASYMERLKGNRITALRLAIGGTLSSQQNYVFVSNRLEGEPLYKQSVAHLAPGWNEITLDTPYEITGEELFIGFKYTSSGEQFSMDGRADNSLANWIRLTQSEADTSSAWQHQGGGSLNLQAIVEGDQLPQHDAELSEIVAKKYAPTQNGAPLSLLVRNMGAADIRTLDITYTIEGHEPVTRTLEGLDLASNETALVRVDDMQFGKAGIYNLDVQIAAVNGQDDVNPADNAGTIENIIAKADYTNRKVLLEHFSTMNCNNCPTAHKTIDHALAYRDDVIHVVHHAGMGTDPLSIDASQAYMYTLYTDGASGSIYAPAATLDRTNLANYGANDGSQSTPGPVFFPQRETFGKLLDQSLSTPALVSVDLNKTYDAASRQLQVSASGRVMAGTADRLKGSDVRLTLFLTEDSLYVDYPQAGADDPYHYVHNCALRHVLTGTWGDAVSFDGGDYASQTYTFSLPSDWNEKNVRIIGFLANYDKANPNNCQVYNTQDVALTAGETSSIAPAQTAGPTLRAWTANGTLTVCGPFRYATLLDATGAALRTLPASEGTTVLTGLPGGFYLLHAHTDEGWQTCKVLVR